MADKYRERPGVKKVKAELDKNPREKLSGLAAEIVKGPEREKSREAVRELRKEIREKAKLLGERVPNAKRKKLQD